MENKKTRNTEKQEQVRNILIESNYAMSAEDIMKSMTVKVNKSTVYRILDRFMQNGFIHSIVDQNGKAFYAPCKTCKEDHTIHNHLHFECQECKEITCQPNTKVEVPNLDGFEIKEAKFLLIGICSKCKA